VTISGGAIEPVILAPVILAIETAGSACSAAVGRGGVVLAAERVALRHGHAELLLPMIERVMDKAGLAPSQLDTVAVAIGPGGFTGIRVGLAAAQGIALAIGARLVGVSSFAAVAARLAGPQGAQPGGGPDSQPLLVALDSRRAELCVQLFARETASPLAAPQAVLADRLGEYIDGPGSSLPGDAPLLIAGDAAEAAVAALGRRAAIAVAGDSAPDAEGVLAAALRQLSFGAPADAIERPVRPLYLRPPDVTLPRRPTSLATASR
jgi:tRNA threonylcarbamoyladenosine biosynthesis protein TsaB